MKTKLLLLLLPYLGMLELTTFYAYAQDEPTIGTITIDTEFNVGDELPLIFTGLDGTDQSITVEGVKAVKHEGKTCYKITQKPVKIIGSIKTFVCAASRIKTLEFKDCVYLTDLICASNVINYLDLSGMSALNYLDCSSSNISTIVLTGCENLKTIKANSNKINRINLAEAPKLEYIYLSLNTLSDINLKGVSCISLDVSSNNLSSLDLSNTKNIEWLSISSNPLESINLSSCTTLQTLRARETKLTEVDLSDLAALTYVDIYGGGELHNITFKGNANLTSIDLSDNQLTSIDLTECPNVTEIDLNANKISEIRLKGLSYLKYLNLKNNKLTNFSIEDSPELYSVELSNNLLTSIDLSRSKKTLEYIYLDGNQLSSLDLKGFESLSTLVASNNQIASVKLDGCENLRYLDISSNQLTAALFTGLNSLYEIYIQENDIHGKAMMMLIQSLPKKTIGENPVSYYDRLYIVKTRSEKERNICLVDHVKSAHERGWGIYDMRTYDEYGGAKLCKVTSKTVGEGGSIKVNGQTTLDEIYSDSRVDITADNQPGYALKSLVKVTKGDIVDIFKDRYFYVLDEETEVVASFTSDVCKVVLKRLGEGTLKLRGEGLDTRGLPRGMEIEVIAESVESSDWELSSLIAKNLKTGEKANILSSKSFVLTEDMEIFAKFTNVDPDYPTTTDTLTWDGTQWLDVEVPFVPNSIKAKIYPNPTTDFVVVSGVQPAVIINIYMLSGTLVHSESASREGYAVLHVADLPEGTYVLLIDSDPHKLIIRH